MPAKNSMSPSRSVLGTTARAIAGPTGIDATLAAPYHRRLVTDVPDQLTQAVPQPSFRGGLTPDTCELLLIRHGRSADVVPGSPESADPPLHEVGHRQAALLATRLDGKAIHVVVSSHLARARQTAEALAAPRGLDVEQIVDLEEVRLGAWSDGEFRRRAAAEDPEFVAWAADRTVGRDPRR